MGDDRYSAGFQYSNSLPTWASNYLFAPLREILRSRVPKGPRVFEIGCGNGAMAHALETMGYDVTAIDASETGIAVARRDFPGLKAHVADVYDDLAARFGSFPVVLSLEVIEHCFHPRRFARTFYDLLEPGGTGIISTPYHGYLKNLALSLTNKWDDHHTALWDGGHIKFFSRTTLEQLLIETGFKDVRFYSAGRIPPLAKSMIAVFSK